MSYNLVDMLDLPAHILEACTKYKPGRRKLDDVLFKDDKPLPRLGVYDLDNESLCHKAVTITCSVPGCLFTAENLLDFESHYNSCHRYSCSACKKVLPTPHLLDLHIQESHDSFFAIMAERKPSYCCYIEECKEKFKTAEERMDHCVKIHKLQKNFRFDQSGKKSKSRKKSKANEANAMDLDNETPKAKTKLVLSTSKTKVFPKYTGKKFTGNNDKKHQTVNNIDMNEIVDSLRESMPK